MRLALHLVMVAFFLLTGAMAFFGALLIWEGHSRKRRPQPIPPRPLSAEPTTPLVPHPYTPSELRGKVESDNSDYVNSGQTNSQGRPERLDPARPAVKHADPDDSPTLFAQLFSDVAAPDTTPAPEPAAPPDSPYTGGGGESGGGGSSDSF